jgi:quinohemoprotein ethanol dehydrogenase
MRTIVLPSAYVLFMLLSCKEPAKFGSPEQIKEATAQVDDQRLKDADKTPGDWLSNGRNYAEDRYSELDQINKENIKGLGLAWSLNLGTTRGIEATQPNRYEHGIS